MSEIPEVLFVCVHNAGRSQMAAALLHHHAAGSVHVTSAGSEPADQVNLAVREVMNEIGIDLSHEFPKKLTSGEVEAADVVITMGCGDACPVFPGKRYLDWKLSDPAGKTAEEIRPIRDDIDTRVRELLAELEAVDIVITLGRDAKVDAPDGVELRNWDTDEPSERGIEGIERMRMIRDDITHRVDSLAIELKAARDTRSQPQRGAIPERTAQQPPLQTDTG